MHFGQLFRKMADKQYWHLTKHHRAFSMHGGTVMKRESVPWISLIVGVSAFSFQVREELMHEIMLQY